MTDPAAHTQVSRASVERATAELRRGGAVAVSAGEISAVVMAAELLTEPALDWLAAIDAKQPVKLLLTAERARALIGNPAAIGHAICDLPPAMGAEAVRQLADPTAPHIPLEDLGVCASTDLPQGLGQAVLDLVKAARLLPAAVAIRVPTEIARGRVDAGFSLAAGDIAAYRRAGGGELHRTGQARVPLLGGAAGAPPIEAEVIAFRPSDGGKEHLAIVIGTPDPARPVLTRLHSECFTGDLLGSLRCDCGDQLRGAIVEIAKQGSGILLYLAQEGRGIGLVNKLRAYRLQDAGADTLEANLLLGFGADERVYRPAAEMLRQLGFDAVRLLTNNPDKVTGLVQSGIRVAERVPHVFPANDENARYLHTKALRFGHMF